MADHIPEYRTWWMADCPPPVFDQKDKIVEEAGYRTTAQMVKEMLLAGERYDALKKMEYDIPPNVGADDAVLPPFRRRGFDPADADRIHRDLEARFKAHQDAVKAYEAEKAEKSAEKPVEPPQEPVVKPEPAKA
jgi:hypothetical protein